MHEAMLTVLRSRALREPAALMVLVMSVCATAVFAADAPSRYAWFEGDKLAADCANLSEAEQQKFRQAGDLLDIRPVCLPRGEWLHRSPDGTPVTHFGWPVAVKIDGVIHVIYSRMFSHSRGPNPLSVVRGCAVTRSVDHGETFRPAASLPNSCLDELGPCSGRVNEEMLARAPWLKKWGTLDGSGPLERLTNMQGSSGPNAAGVINGKIVVASARGVYRSDDNGESWQLLEEAGMPEQIPTFPSWGQGPDLLARSDSELVSLGATKDGTLLVRTSRDEGASWEEQSFFLGEPIQEPAGCFYDGRLILMPRTQRATGVARPGEKGYYQYWFDENLTTFEKALTNIITGERDTTDVRHNPASGRIEALVTNRAGGGPGRELDNCMSVNLWSISPEDLLAGRSEWRFDGTLLRSEGKEHDRDNPLMLERDGLCPGGTIIDTERGVQYVYVYTGHFTGPTGIFQVRRTLDTDALREYLLRSDRG